MSGIKACIGTLIAVLIVAAAPLAQYTSASLSAECAADEPSCAPHQNWYCFHPGMEEPLQHYCDPNDQGCLQ